MEIEDELCQQGLAEKQFSQTGRGDLSEPGCDSPSARINIMYMAKGFFFFFQRLSRGKLFSPSIVAQNTTLKTSQDALENLFLQDTKAQGIETLINPFCKCSVRTGNNAQPKSQPSLPDSF